MLIGQLCHNFDQIRFFAGDVAAVQAFYHEVTDTQFIYLLNVRFTSGAVGQLELNGIENRHQVRDITEVVELIGLQTRVVCEDEMSVRYVPKTDWSDAVPEIGRFEQVWRPSWISLSTADAFGYLGEVRHFALRCLGQATGGPDLWDSYKALQIGEAVYESAHGAGLVEITA